MQRKLTFTFLAFTFALIFAASGRASTIIYSNIDPGDTFGPGVAIGVEPFVGVFNYAGLGFKAGADHTFDSVEMAVSLFSGPNVLDVYLMGTAGGLPSGILESFELDNELTTDPATGIGHDRLGHASAPHGRHGVLDSGRGWPDDHRILGAERTRHHGTECQWFDPWFPGAGFEFERRDGHAG